MSLTCPKQIVRVVLVEFGERHDTRTNGQHYTAAYRRPTGQVSAWRAERQVARHARLPRSILVTIMKVMTSFALRTDRRVFYVFSDLKKTRLFTFFGNDVSKIR